MRNLRVLIVEDESIIAMDLQDILADAGHTVVGIAMTMAQALQIAADAAPIDLAVLDIDLARGDDGIETADRLRKEHGVEALFVSAHLEEEERARSLGWKPLGFVSKPYLPSQVLSVLQDGAITSPA